VAPTILVVEDEPAIQELLAVNLKHNGFLVVRAGSAEDADAAIRAALPDLLILDWMLPGQSGVSLAKRLRSDERTRELPIIMLTARVHEEDKVPGWRPAPTTTSPSRSRRRNWLPACAPSSVAACRTWPARWSRSARCR